MIPLNMKYFSDHKNKSSLEQQKETRKQKKYLLIFFRALFGYYLLINSRHFFLFDVQMLVGPVTIFTPKVKKTNKKKPGKENQTQGNIDT